MYNKIIFFFVDTKKEKKSIWSDVRISLTYSKNIHFYTFYPKFKMIRQ